MRILVFITLCFLYSSCKNAKTSNIEIRNSSKGLEVKIRSAIFNRAGFTIKYTVNNLTNHYFLFYKSKPLINESDGIFNIFLIKDNLYNQVLLCDKNSEIYSQVNFNDILLKPENVEIIKPNSMRRLSLFIDRDNICIDDNYFIDSKCELKLQYGLSFRISDALNAQLKRDGIYYIYNGKLSSDAIEVKYFK